MLVGCGPEFDPASKLQSLRILAVKKDDPYVRVTAPTGTTGATDPTEGEYQPDNEVTLTVALEDARRPSERLGKLQKLWFAGCSNPYGDSYFACLPSVWLTFKAFEALHPEPLEDGETWGLRDVENPADILAFVMDAFPQYVEQGTNGQAALTPDEQAQLLEQAMALRLGAGDSFSYEIPSWLIEQHPPSTDPDIPNYGLSQIYLAVCDGQIGLAEAWSGDIDPLTVMSDATMGFPLTCYEPDSTKERGPNHFMVSYSNVFAYEKLSNKNPVIRGIRFGEDVVSREALCIGDACETYANACDIPSAPHVKRCVEEKADACDKYDVKPELDEAVNAETDTVSTNAGSGGRDLREQMWIRYYADRGDLRYEVKRLQDANEGWFDEHGTEWTVPRTSGSAMIWAVAYDNRGGVDWVRLPVCIED
jgi:hypothetical protein